MNGRLKFFVNAWTSKDAGGRSILKNFLESLVLRGSRNHYVVLVPDRNDYLSYECDFIEIIDLDAIYTFGLFLPLSNWLYLPRMIDLLSVDAVLNLSDVAIPTTKKQAFLFDWPYAAYPKSVVWSKMSTKDWVFRKLKLYLFKKSMKYVELVIVQTEAMKGRLAEIYGFGNIEVVPNAVSMDHFGDRESKCERKYKFSKKKNLLCLTKYYPHKNLEILIPLALEIMNRDLDIGIVTTIEPCQHKMAGRFLNNISSLGLDSIIQNIGVVDMPDIPELFDQTDGLLLPTLLESFSGTYVEAMYHKKPIFTSGMDFAHAVCKESGIYFDPLNYKDILEKIENSIFDEKLIVQKVQFGENLLNGSMTWDEASKHFESKLEGIARVPNE